MYGLQHAIKHTANNCKFNGYELVWPMSCLVILVNDSGGILMYRWYASLCHLPKAWHGNCVCYTVSHSNSVCVRSWLKQMVLVSPKPSEVVKSAPSCFPLARRYFRSACAGHTDCWVLVSWMQAPCLRGSVFDCLIQSLTVNVIWRLSDDISDNDRWVSGS